MIDLLGTILSILILIGILLFAFVVAIPILVLSLRGEKT